MPLPQQRRWTAREVRGLIASSPLATPRYELVDGELLVTPSPRFVHQRAVTSLIVALARYLEQDRIGIVLPSPSDVELEPEFLTQPDVFVVPMHEGRRARAEGTPIREALLVIEVLSPSSGHHDRVRKRPGYQRNVPEYWIVDLDARLFERWTPGDARPEILTTELAWRPAGAAATFTLDVAAYFREILED